MTEPRKVACPSCQTQIEVDERGEPISGDLGHFDLHKQLVDRVSALETGRAAKTDPDGTTGASGPSPESTTVKDPTVAPPGPPATTRKGFTFDNYLYGED
jgi:hypothetical protein